MAIWGVFVVAVVRNCPSLLIELENVPAPGAVAKVLLMCLILEMAPTENTKNVSNSDSMAMLSVLHYLQGINKARVFSIISNILSV